ncbi:MAG: hypothetical protein AB8G11_22365, partial [Saprospiraceae bacterium]
MKFLRSPFILLLGLLLLFSDMALAQTTATIGTGTSSSSTRGPFQRADTNSTTVFSRWHQVYTASELAAAGIVSGASISELKWELASSNVIIGSGNATLQIYIKNSSATGATTDTWANLISGSTMVVNNTYNTTNNFPGANGWMPFSFSQPFVYTGGALEISVDWDCSQVSTPAFSGNGAIKFRWESTAPDDLVVKKTASSSAPSTLSDLKNERANIQIVHSPPLPTTVDLTVSVDMSQYTSSFTTAYISGTFNNWSGTANPLTDQGNGIWQSTITVNANDSIEYKFSLDDWSAQESFTGTEPCTKTSFGFTNRFLSYGNMNMTLDTVCWNSCMACPASPPATVDITFLVNTANITVDPTGIFLAGGGIFGNPGDNPMVDSNNDGIWEITVTKNQGIAGNYIFLNGSTSGWNAKENLQGLPCSDPINYDDRILPLIWNDTTIMTCFETCSADTTCPAPTPTIDLTFSVDMSQYTGSTANGVFINGSFNNWSGSSNPLTDQGNGIWSGTITVPENDSIEYKFTVDGWNDQENFTGAEPCTKTTGPNTNRLLVYGNTNMTVPTVCWNSCTACVTNPTTVDLTVSVDMSQYTGTFTTAYVFGSFNSWNGTANPLTDQGNGIWSGTITVPENDSIEYKFLADGTQENFTGGEPCTKTTGAFTNRLLIYGNTNMTVPTVCWESCVACVVAPTTVDLTVSVDMSQYTSPFTTAYISGDFNNWSGTSNPLTDQGNGIWSGTITVPENDS